MTRQGQTWRDTTKQDKTRQDYTIQEKTRQDQWKSRQNKTRQDRTRQDKTGQDRRSLFFMAPPFSKNRMRQNCTSCSVLSGKYTTDPFFLLKWNLAHTSYIWRRRFYFGGPGILSAESGKFAEIWCNNYLPHDIFFKPDGLDILADAPTHRKFLHFQRKKQKLLLLKTNKIPPAAKSCRLPPKGVVMRQSYLSFFAARIFFLPHTLILSRIQHLYRLHPAHMFTQEAKPCRVHMLFYPTHNIHPASGHEVSSPSKICPDTAFSSLIRL